MSKGWRWVGLSLLLVAMAVGLLGWQARRPEQGAVAAPASAPAVGAFAVASPAQPGQASAPARAMVGAASRPPKVDAAKEFIEVCGVGQVRRSELEPGEGQPEPAWSREFSRLSEQGLPDMLKRLDAGSPRQRVAAAAMRGDAQVAAQLAASTDDVRTYRLALRACRKDGAYRAYYPVAVQQRARMAASAASGFEMPEMAAPGPLPSACAALNLERLELLDPGDAWPALLRLHDAFTRGDEAGVTQALYQVAQKSRLSANGRALSAVMADVVGSEPTPGESWALVSAIGIDAAAFIDGSLLSLGRPCRADALKDANRRQLCEQVARRMPGMVAESTDARALHALEERLGLPHSPQALSREEVERGLKAMTEEGSRWMAEPTCAHFSKMGQQMVKLAREGELAWIRAYLKATPASAPR